MISLLSRKKSDFMETQPISVGMDPVIFEALRSMVVTLASSPNSVGMVPVRPCVIQKLCVVTVVKVMVVLVALVQ